MVFQSKWIGGDSPQRPLLSTRPLAPGPQSSLRLSLRFAVSVLSRWQHERSRLGAPAVRRLTAGASCSTTSPSPGELAERAGARGTSRPKPRTGRPCSSLLRRRQWCTSGRRGNACPSGSRQRSRWRCRTAAWHGSRPRSCSSSWPGTGAATSARTTPPASSTPATLRGPPTAPPRPRAGRASAWSAAGRPRRSGTLAATVARAALRTSIA
mmetsp:Transcript_44104/g.127557  ORF Transcript_44104/g.127557 Transcript_44104/m.127557 type:complete len:211 (-) Transcript_44104:374-1006(-)